MLVAGKDWEKNMTAQYGQSEIRQLSMIACSDDERSLFSCSYGVGHVGHPSNVLVHRHHVFDCVDFWHAQTPTGLHYPVANVFGHVRYHPFGRIRRRLGDGQPLPHCRHRGGCWMLDLFHTSGPQFLRRLENSTHHRHLSRFSDVTVSLPASIPSLNFV